MKLRQSRRTPATCRRPTTQTKEAPNAANSFPSWNDLFAGIGAHGVWLCRRPQLQTPGGEYAGDVSRSADRSGFCYVIRRSEVGGSVSRSGTSEINPCRTRKELRRADRRNTHSAGTSTVKHHA